MTSRGPRVPAVARAAEVLAVVLLAVALCGAAAAPGPWGVTRIGGGDRYATAVRLSEHRFPAGSDVVVLASGADFPDAVVAGPAAAAFSAPLLLTGPSVLPDAVRDELVRLGPSTAVLVGGPSALSDGVLQAVEALGVTTLRVTGADRYATAARLAVTLVRPGRTGGEVLLAAGASFPDGLSAGAAGAGTGAPVLLSERSGVPASTIAALRDLAPVSVLVVGGPAVVGDAAVLQMQQQLPSARVTRIAGPDRYATAAALQRRLRATAPDALVASGEAFPDALVSSALGQPLVLVRRRCLPAASAALMGTWGVRTVTVLGGTSAVEDAAASGRSCG